LCIDDQNIQRLLPRIGRQYLTYGFSEDADVYASEVHLGLNHCTFTVRGKLCDGLTIRLNLPGRHNILNALAAIGVALEEGIAQHAIQQALSKFEGIGRRFEILGDFPREGGDITLVDDYGHHPTEVDATIAVARNNWPDRRLVMAYQPHRFTRTKDLYEDFVRVLSQVDVLLLLEVYSAGEEPIDGADSKSLCRSIRQRGDLEPVYVENLEDISSVLANVLQPGDVLMTQGAGNIGALAKTLQGTGLQVAALKKVAQGGARG
jgi:UDP-N-acetylmuramate--alanine ligase